MCWQYCIYKVMGENRTVDYCDGNGPKQGEI